MNNKSIGRINTLLFHLPYYKRQATGNLQAIINALAVHLLSMEQWCAELF